MYEEYQRSNTQRISNPINKWANELDRQFSQKVQMPINKWKNVQYP
jgi:hypothetical protein